MTTTNYTMKQINLRNLCLRASKALKSPRNKSIFGKSARKEKAEQSSFIPVLNITRDGKIENVKPDESIKIALDESHIYAEVFDSLNVDIPPPLPSRKALARTPARPPYSSSCIKCL